MRRQITSRSARLRRVYPRRKTKTRKEGRGTKGWESSKLELPGRRRCRSSLSRRPLRSRWGRDSEIVCQVGEGGGLANKIWGRTGLGARNEMRMAKEEKLVVIKIHERHIAFVVVRRWLGGREGGGWASGGSSGGGSTGINRIVSIHPSGSSRDLDATISSLYCLACRITRPRPLPHPSVTLSLSLEKCSFTLFVVSRLSLSLGRSRHYFPLFVQKKERTKIFSRDSLWSVLKFNLFNNNYMKDKDPYLWLEPLQS